MRALLTLAMIVCFGCARPPTPLPTAAVRLVFVHQPLWGDPAAFNALLDTFRREHPHIELVTQLLPNDSDVSHQYFLTSLEGQGADFDVLVADVVWVPEFARAGWISDLSADFPQTELAEDFLPAAISAVTWEGKTWAVPWYLDVGLLYYRTDLVPHAPRTWGELETFARAAMKKDPALQGFLWQGRQYEGLVCNVYETLWGFGGKSLENGHLALDTPEAAKALHTLRRFVERGLSPPSVTSAAEEESRRPFQDGRAVFMRNWPYAFGEAQKEGSLVRGKVGVSFLPTASGEPGFGTLGGWQLAINARTPPERRAAAVELIRALTSSEANVKFARAYGRNPARRSAYAALKDTSFAQLEPMLERARPRPVTPYYGMISDILQSEFSAAISGIRSPEEALQQAQRQVDRVMGAQ
ncbi:MAG: ABC transporter substrate-binding protein [Archangium sp.]|nr:ABC transporter substrate-binding protein [Archangium sp.]